MTLSLETFLQKFYKYWHSKIMLFVIVLPIGRTVDLLIADLLVLAWSRNRFRPLQVHLQILLEESPYINCLNPLRWANFISAQKEWDGTVKEISIFNAQRLPRFGNQMAIVAQWASCPTTNIN